MTRAIRRQIKLVKQNIELRNEFNSCGVATTLLAGDEFPTDGACSSRWRLGKVNRQNNELQRSFIGKDQGIVGKPILPPLQLYWANLFARVFIYTRKATPEGKIQTHA